MRFCFLCVFVVFAVNVCGVSAGDDWWGGARKAFKDYWKKNKDSLIKNLLGVLVQGRDVDGIDANGDRKLDSTELAAHLDTRDVDEIMSELDSDENGELTEEEVKRYITDVIDTE